LLACAANAGSGSDASPKPSLIVAVSVDQFSAGLFDQYRARFTGGLKRMQDQGVIFPNGYQSHAATETCPGHSTLLTGRHPSATGVISNNWYDTRAGRNVYCVEDPTMTVPHRPKDPRGPGYLKVSTLGEWMKQANPASRNIAVSGKDRAAIMMSGHNPDAVFWWDAETGFNTYVPPGANETERLAPVADFNAALAKRWAKALPVWKPLDGRCASLAGTQSYGDLTVHHQVPPPWKATDPAKGRNDPAFTSWFRASPELDRLTLSLAGELFERYQLGKGPAPDLLSISLSATDYVGHRYGNQSAEMCDQLAHLDHELGLFFQKLDASKVPYLVVLSADHGAVDAAEVVAQRAFAAQRLTDTLFPEINHQVRDALQLELDPFKGGITELYVSPEITAAALRDRIVATALSLLQQRPDVAAVFTKREILAVTVPKNKPADELTLLERFAESFDAERNGDLLIALQPYATWGKASADYIAGHGSPWNYDRRVPILFWWPGAQGYEQYLPVETVDIAPTLAALIGVATPTVDGRCLDLDRGEGTTCLH